MNSDLTTGSTTTATAHSLKPQIFINHVDKSISAEMIQAACDAICEPNTSNVVLRPSHDNNYKNCSITLNSEENSMQFNISKTIKYLHLRSIFKMAE